MKLKPQPRAQPSAGRKGSRGAARPARRGGGRGKMARRPGPSLRSRVTRRMPPLGRLLAAVAGVAAAAGLIALLNGPWLLVTDVAWGGDHYTNDDDVADVLGELRGASMLSVDTTALAASLERLPAVAEATVQVLLPGRIEAQVVERTPAFVWQTPGARLIGASDGTLFAALPVDEPLPATMDGLSVIIDDRRGGHLLRVGDEIPAGLVDVAERLTAIDAAALGSAASATTMRVSLDDTYGFQLIADDPGWRIAFGFYTADPEEAATNLGGRIDDQVAAVRTLFAAEAEAGIGWVDARNPGKVYFRAKG
jgi:hypothetical protein